MKRKFINKVLKYGSDILTSDNIIPEKQYIHHGNTSVLQHSFNVACISLLIVHFFKINAHEKELVRGSLLHDYFLYDWHTYSPSEGLHGFTHARRALKNAKRDFSVNTVEEDIIEKHMFPLNIALPRYKESVIVCIADKASTIIEVFRIKKLFFAQNISK